MTKLTNLLFLLIFSFIIFLVVFLVTPPKTWPEASLFQILIFFIPTLLSLTFLVNVFLNYLPRSFIISLGVVLLVVLYTSSQLSFLSFLVVLIFIIIFLKSFPKMRYPRLRLTRFTKINKLTGIERKNR